MQVPPAILAVSPEATACPEAPFRTHQPDLMLRRWTYFVADSTEADVLARGRIHRMVKANASIISEAIPDMELKLGLVNAPPLALKSVPPRMECRLYCNDFEAAETVQ